MLIKVGNHVINTEQITNAYRLMKIDRKLPIHGQEVGMMTEVFFPASTQDGLDVIRLDEELGDRLWEFLCSLATDIMTAPVVSAAGPQSNRCPRCDSPDPARHPAMQADGGEVQVCLHPWHTPIASA